MTSEIIPIGFCQCGCGGLAPIAKQTRNDRGFKEGEPQKFIKGHHPRAENSPTWKGGRTNIKGKYPAVYAPSHPRSMGWGHTYVAEHIFLAEKALGKSLPLGAQVHHHTPEQLVICQDCSYHNLLHLRQRALRACGHANWRHCHFCKRYDDIQNMTKNHKGFHHKECRNAYMRSYNRQKRSKGEHPSKL